MAERDINATIAAWDSWAREVNEGFKAGQLKAAAVKPGQRFAGAPSAESIDELDAMVVAAGSEYLAPFSAAITSRMATKLWSEIEPFVNRPEPQPIDGFDLRGAWSQLRSLLDGIIAGKPTLLGEATGGWGVRLPLTLICRRDGKVYWSLAGLGTRTVDGKPMPYTAAERAHRLVNEAGAACLLLLWHPRLRSRIRRCANASCSRFALLQRSKGERRHFCEGSVCRKAWEASPEGRANVKARVAAHRTRQPRGWRRRA